MRLLLLSGVLLAASAATARAEVRAVTVGVHTTCPYGLAA